MQPKSTISVFNNGRILINTRSEEDTEKAVENFKRTLSERFSIPFEVEYKIQNLNGTIELNQGFECGTLRAIFPDAEKTDIGDGYRVYLGKYNSNFVFF